MLLMLLKTLPTLVGKKCELPTHINKTFSLYFASGSKGFHRQALCDNATRSVAGVSFCLLSRLILGVYKASYIF